MKIKDMNWMQVESFLQNDNRAILSLGSTEQHGYISLCTDFILAQKLANEAAEKTNIPSFPAIPYGIAPYFMAYPGTITIRPDTYFQFVTDVIHSIYQHGFKKLLVINGHGGNSGVHAQIMHDLNTYEDLEVKFHNWWASPSVMKYIKSIHPIASHASWMENFPWTRIQGVVYPDTEKPLIDILKSQQQSAKKARKIMGDGNYGGVYIHDDKDMQTLWNIAIQETVDLIENGWLS